MNDSSQEGTLSEVPCLHCGDPHPPGYTHCPKTGKPLTTGEALVGRIVADRYRVLGLLGEGGMGAVYIAEHMLIGRQVALKRLHPEFASDETTVARFQREARAAAATGHENIVDVIDLGFAEDGAPFLVMEYIKGRSLAEALRQERQLAPSRACHIVGQALAALTAVHEQGIVHRDLKPDNIFLTRRGGRMDFVKVLDFGVSKITREEEPLQLTRTGMMVGTPYYMSPEQARGDKVLDHRVDLYAAGVILYECLSGRLPFEGQNYHALLRAIVTRTPEPLEALVRGLDPDLGVIVARAMAGEPDARFGTAREMWEALLPYGAIPAEVSHSDTAPPPSAAHGRSARTEAGQNPIPAPPRNPRGLSSLPSTRSTPPPDEPRVSPDALPHPRPGTGPARRFSAASSDWVEESGVSASPGRTEAPAGEPSQDPTEARMSSAPPRGSRSDATIRGSTQVKGSMLLSAIEYLEQAHGREGLNEVIRALEPDARGRLGGVILPVGWFPIEVYDSLIGGADLVLGTGTGDIAEAVGSAVAARELPNTHRMFIQSATPAAAVARIPQLWSTYHSTGHARVERAQGGGFRVETLGLTPDTLVHAISMTGFFRRLIELAGGRDVRALLLSSRGRGDGKTITSLRWR